MNTLSRKNGLCCDLKQDTDSHFLGSPLDFLRSTVEKGTGALMAKALSPLDLASTLELINNLCPNISCYILGHKGLNDLKFNLEPGHIEPLKSEQ